MAKQSEDQSVTGSPETVFGIKLSEANVYQKIAAAKMEIGAIAKKDDNPFFKSKYFDINSLLHHCEPILFKYRLFALQPIIGGQVVSRIINIDNTSEIDETSWTIPPTIMDPQKVGSAITYFRRYLLQAQLGLQAEDDDGNKAAAPPRQPAKQAPAAQAPAKQPAAAKPNPKAEEAIAKCVKAIGEAKNAKELGEVWKKVPEKLQKLDKITRAAAAKKASLTPKKDATPVT